MDRGGWTEPPEDTVAEMYLRGMERLELAGYRQYEISNLARPGRESRHNLKYWTDGQWVGFGSGAHSTRDGVRWKNVVGTEEYIARCEAGEGVGTDRQVLSARRRFEDAMMMALRLSAGVDLDGHRAAVRCGCVADLRREPGLVCQRRPAGGRTADGSA